MIEINVLFVEVVFQLLATALLLFILYKKTYTKFQEYLDKRANFINDAIENTKTNEKEAIALKDESVSKMAEIKIAQKELLETSKKEAQTEREEILEEAKVKAQYVLDKNSKQIEQDVKTAQQELNSEVLAIASQVAESFLSKKISDEDDLEFIKNAVAKAQND